MSTNRANYLYPSIGMGLILSAIIFVVILVPRWTFRPPKPDYLRDYTAQELRGREIYKREGCWYCHSQVSRPQDWDHGPISHASDYYYDQYHLVGSERSGPDLSNIGGKFPDEYHILHHQNPRYVKPGSNMPRYDYLSMQELVDLTAYLQSLGAYGTRELDPKTGEMKYAVLYDPANPDRVYDKFDPSHPELIARWKDGVAGREQLANKLYEEHPEVPYAYTKQIEELAYTTPKEKDLQNAKTPVNAMVKKVFANEDELAEARQKDETVSAWDEVSFKEPAVEPTDPVGLASLQKIRQIANQGRGLFNNECSTCHGLSGDGHGWSAYSMTKRPANFHEAKFANYRTDTWFWRISVGVPGTQMPVWEKTLGADQRMYLAAFLKYVAQNGGLGKLEGMPADSYGLPPSAYGIKFDPAAPAATK
jgi:cbb3-type cytochrome oxidase cytochrome c subunit